MSHSFSWKVIIIFESVTLFWFEVAENSTETGLSNFEDQITKNFKVGLALSDSPAAQ